MLIVETDRAPRPLGPYSQAIVAGNLVFCSGQLGIEPSDGKLVEGVRGQTERCLMNIEGLLEAAGSSMRKVVKITILFKDVADMRTINEVYEKSFHRCPPARTVAQVVNLPMNALIMIDAIAEL